MASRNPYREGESWKTGSSAKREGIAEYLEWLLTPTAERIPPTKTELAELLGVSVQTLRNWSKDAWLQRELGERGRTLARVERAQDILDSLYEQARDPENPRSVQAAKVLLDYMDRPADQGATADPSELTDEELAEIALQILQRLSR